MRVFVVSPANANLPDTNIEISAIDRNHTAVICRGYVRSVEIEERLQRALAEGRIDVFWWISHGSRQGVLLSDGLLSIAGVRQFVRQSGARLCVLNTCESEDVARSTMIGGIADMICAIGQIDNQEAVRLGSGLAAELAKTNDFYAAYNVVNPDDGSYEYLTAKATTVNVVTTPQRKKLMPDEATELRRAIDQLSSSMNASNVAMVRLEGTVERNNDVTKRSMDSLKEQMTVFQAQVASRAPVWVAYATLAFMAIIALIATVGILMMISQRGI